MFKDEKKKKSEIDQRVSAFDFKTNVICGLCLQKFLGFLLAAPSLCFLGQCKIARTIEKGTNASQQRP